MLLANLALGVLLSQSPAQPPAPVGRISGQVVEAGTNAPVAGVRVLLIAIVGPAEGRFRGPMGPPTQAVTDADGRYVFNGLPAGRYSVTAQKSGFAPTNGLALPNRAIDLAAGQALDALVIAIQKGGAITGHVLDTAGEPLADARVLALRRPRPGSGAAGVPRLLPAGPGGQTNDLGEFRIYDLAPDEYFVVVSPQTSIGLGGPSGPGPILVPTYYPGVADVGAAQTVKVNVGDTATDLVIRVATAPAFEVSGVVVDETGAPVSGALIMLMPDPRSTVPMAGIRVQGQSDAEGRFIIGGVPSGSYLASATVPVTFAGPGGASGGVAGGAAGVSFSWSAASGNAVGRQAALQITVDGADLSDVRIILQK